MSQVVVVRDSALKEVPNWLSTIDETDSAVEFREIRCDSEDVAGAHYDAVCKPSSADDAITPYLLVLPYGVDGKKAVSLGTSPI